MFAHMNTLFPRLLAKHSLFGAGADARARGGVFACLAANVGSKGARVAANIGSKGAAVAANLAGSTARAAVAANLAAAEIHSNGKVNAMNTATSTAAIMAATATAAPVVKVYTEEETAAMEHANRACDTVANGAPLAYIAALCIADAIAGGVILEPRGKHPARVALMKHAKEAFGSERTAFRYPSLALSYKLKFADDIGEAVKARTKDATGAAIGDARAQITRAAEMLLAMMANRGARNMFGLAKALGHEESRTGKGKKGDKSEGAADEGKSAAEGQPPAKPDAMTSAQRLAVILPMIEAGGFTAEEHKALSAALAKVKPARVQKAKPEAESEAA